MIPVPDAVLDILPLYFGITVGDLRHFAGGGEEGDGIVYAYPDGNSERLLKVVAFAEADQRRSLLCLNERLKFAHFLGERGARIAYPRPLPQGRLYEMVSHGDHRWVAYTMESARGKTASAQAWDPDFFRNWGQTIGMYGGITSNPEGHAMWKSMILTQPPVLGMGIL